MNGQTHIGTLPSALVSQVEAVFQRDSKADCIALVSRGGLPNKEYRHDIAGVEVRWLYCVSELAMREALIEHSSRADDQRLVLIAPFGVANLAQDVLARIWRNEPQRLSPWRSLQQLLKVRDIDPRLIRKENRWMADSLLSGYDRIRLNLTFGEVLDLDSAWRAIALAHLDYTGGVVDLRSILQWSAKVISTSNGSDRLAAAPEDVKNHLEDWLKRGEVPAAEAISGILLGKHASDLLPLALACSVLYCPETEAELGGAQFHVARGKFTERYLSGVTTPHNHVLKSFGDEAMALLKDWIRREKYSNYSAVLGKAEQILISLDMTRAAEASDLLLVGLQARFTNFAKSLNDAVDGKSVDLCERDLEYLHKHQLIRLDLYKASLDKAEMAMRLVRWLSGSAMVSGTASELMSDYVDNGGFCDWARTEIWAGDSKDDLNDAYLKLAKRVRDVREKQNQAFGAQLRSIAMGDQLPGNLIPVEDALDRLVAPLGTGGTARVLLLVLDGMSQAVYRQLNKDLIRHNWMELKPEGGASSGCLVAALPTITEVSRCSLLSGALCAGRAADEKLAFASHATLKRLSSTRTPPVLFHKQDLSQSGSGSLNGDVRRIIAGTEHRFTAVVINAIDDQLSSSAQVSVDWSFDSISLLRQVMDAARESGRTVIITSDHGHVLEHDSVFQQTETQNGERYWVADHSKVPAPTESLVSGDRVVVEGNSAVLPWSEQVRYVRGKNHGYHGGGSLQEVVIPLGIYVCASTDFKDVPEGWIPTAFSFPDWWSASQGVNEPGIAEPVAPDETKKKSTKTKREAVAEVVDDLFASEPAESSKPLNTDWLGQLVKSQAYIQNRERSRVPVKDQDVLDLLNLLSSYQWQIMENQVARELGIPKIRLRGFLANIQRLLNVDGYPILSVERDTQTIRLNVSDLRKQFELKQ